MYKRQKLGTVVIPRNFIHHDFDSVFEHQYVSLEGKIIPAGSPEEKELKKIYGFYHPQTGTIHLRPSANVGHALHEAIHKFSSSGFRNLFGHNLDEGVTHYFTNLILAEQGLTESSAYELQLK